MSKITPPDLVDEAMETPEDALIVETASKVLAELGGEPEPVGVPFGCDVTKLSRAGIPGIIFGPGSIDQATNGAIEYVELDQLEVRGPVLRGRRSCSFKKSLRTEAVAPQV